MLRRIQLIQGKPFPASVFVLALMCFAVAVQSSCTNKTSNQAPAGAATPIATVPPKKPDPKGLKKAAKEVVDKLAAQDYEGVTKSFDEKMKKSVPLDKLRKDWTANVQKFGSCRDQSEPSLERSPDGYDLVLIRCRMDQGFLDIEVDYDDAGNISGLWLRPVS